LDLDAPCAALSQVRRLVFSACYSDLSRPVAKASRLRQSCIAYRFQSSFNCLNCENSSIQFESRRRET
jgi:hypothetical protein